MDKALEDANEQLTAAYKTALARSEEKTRDLWEKSQAPWTAYVQAECNLEGDPYSGGNGVPDAIYACSFQETRRRMQQIQDLTDWSSH